MRNRRSKGSYYLSAAEHYALKRLREEVNLLKREVSELRQGRDARRWPELVTQLRSAEKERDELGTRLAKLLSEAARIRARAELEERLRVRP